MKLSRCCTFDEQKVKAKCRQLPNTFLNFLHEY